MKNKKINSIIKSGIDNEVPDVLNNVLMNCREVKTKEERKKFHFPLKNILAFSSFVIMAFIISFISFNNRNMSHVDSTIIFDINPSVELNVSADNTILSAKALNSDGKKILADMDLTGSKLNVGVNALIGSMCKNGYINELKNSVLITVDSKNKERSAKLQAEITKEIDEALNAYSLEPAVLTQDYNVSSETETIAKTYGISNSKAQLLEKIVNSNLTNKNGEKYTFDDLVNLNINELNVILNSKNAEISNLTSNGTASTKAYITKNQVKQIALSNANLNENAIYDLEIEFDYEYNTMIYEISFKANGREYDYEIDAITGNIIKAETERDDDYIHYQNTGVNNSSTNYTKPSNNNQNSNNNSTNYISRNQAKQIALSNAGLTEANIYDLSIEFDREGTKYIYEVDFEYGNKDYEYDIDAITGKILYKNIERDD